MQPFLRLVCQAAYIPSVLRIIYHCKIYQCTLKRVVGCCMLRLPSVCVAEQAWLKRSLIIISIINMVMIIIMNMIIIIIMLCLPGVCGMAKQARLKRSRSQGRVR